jgi:hypothetical protein
MSHFAGQAVSFRHRLKNICLGKKAFITGVIVLAVFKLWLVHEEEIYGSANFFDQLNYLRAAESWYWGAEYSWTSFIRAPGYPLWIALVHTTGLPLRTAQELLFLGGYAVLIAALRAAGVSRPAALLIYAAAILHPASFQLHNQVLTDNLYAAILPMALAGLIFIFLRSRVLDALWTGVVLGLLWNIREETILICVLLAVFLALFFWRNFLGTRSWKASTWAIRKPALALFGVLAFLVLAVDYANYRVFDAFAKSEFSAPSFKAAYKALLRIRPDKVIRFVPVSRETRARAYEVSPTFARLKPELEGKTGQDWEYEGRANLGIDNEIAGGWFFWALRDAANKTGVHETASEAASFYWKVAEEINRACDEKRLPTRTVIFSLLDPATLSSLELFPRALRRISRPFVSRYPRSLQHEDFVLRKWERRLYDEMASRRAAYSRLGILQVAGWAHRSGDPVKFVGLCDDDGNMEAASNRFSPRPDSMKYFPDDSLVPPNSQFGLSMDLFRTGDPSPKLIFITESGAKFTGSLVELSNLKSPASITGAGGVPLMCFIDSQGIIRPPKSVAVALEEFVSDYYRSLVRALVYAGVLATLVSIICFRRTGLEHPICGVLLLLAVTVASRVGLFVFLDATSFPANEPRYLFPIMPLFTCFLILLIRQSAQVAYETTIAKNARRSETEFRRQARSQTEFGNEGSEG